MLGSLQIGESAICGRLGLLRKSCRVAAAALALSSLAGPVLPAAAQTLKVQTIKVTGAAKTSAPAKLAASGNAASRPHIYLMRGLMNIFSLGMDQLAGQIASNGIEANVYNHSVADTVVGNIVQKYRGGDHGPYILVGHSLGADAVMTMAQQLSAQGVPVALVVPFDGTGSYAAPGNVACVLNVTQRAYAYMQAGAGFHGKLSNVDVSSDTSIDHITIDKSPRLQGMALTAVLQVARGQSCRPAGGAANVARSKELPLPSLTNETAPKQAAPAKNAAPEKNASPQNSATPAKSASPVSGPGREG